MLILLVHHVVNVSDLLGTQLEGIEKTDVLMSLCRIDHRYTPLKLSRSKH